MHNRTYSMSEAYSCPKVLVATKLGYEPTPRTELNDTLLLHASRCEGLASQQMLDLGFRLEPPSLCQSFTSGGME